MLYLHCTNKFVKHLGLIVSNAKPDKTRSFLSDWSATYFWHNDQMVYLIVNNETLFSFTVRDLHPSTYKLDIFAGLIDSLQRAEIPFETIDSIRNDLRDIVIKKSSNRHILGSINDLVFMYQYSMKLSESDELINMNEIEKKMTNVPFKYLNYKYPIDIMNDKLNINK